MLFGLAQQKCAESAAERRQTRRAGELHFGFRRRDCVVRAAQLPAPESAFGLLMALVVSALVINWAMISLAHMMFRRAKQQQGVKPASRPCFIRSAMFSACCLWRRY